MAGRLFRNDFLPSAGSRYTNGKMPIYDIGNGGFVTPVKVLSAWQSVLGEDWSGGIAGWTTTGTAPVAGAAPWGGGDQAILCHSTVGAPTSYLRRNVALDVGAKVEFDLYVPVTTGYASLGTVNILDLRTPAGAYVSMQVVSNSGGTGMRLRPFYFRQPNASTGSLPVTKDFNLTAATKYRVRLEMRRQTADDPGSMLFYVDDVLIMAAPMLDVAQSNISNVFLGVTSSNLAADIDLYIGEIEFSKATQTDFDPITDKIVGLDGASYDVVSGLVVGKTAGAAHLIALTAGQSGNLTPPPNAVGAWVDGIGGGGGGGSGRRGAAGSVRCGGGSGAGSSKFSGLVSIDVINSDYAGVLPYSVGAKGTGGAAVTSNNTNGNAGTQGGDTTCGPFRTRGGNPGQGGTATTGTGGSSFTATFAASNGASASTSGAAGTTSAQTATAGCGGSSGGGITSGDADSAGGNGQTKSGENGSLAAAAGGTASSGVAGGNGGSVPTGFVSGGAGGAGGGSNSTGTAGAGGNAGNYGSGGGGGGASLNGNNSGKGGDGAEGMLIVRWMF